MIKNISSFLAAYSNETQLKILEKTKVGDILIYPGENSIGALELHKGIIQSKLSSGIICLEVFKDALGHGIISETIYENDRGRFNQRLHIIIDEVKNKKEYNKHITYLKERGVELK
jgi:hypothetical protein